MEQTTETKLGRKKHQKKMYWVYVHTSKYHTHVHTYIRMYAHKLNFLHFLQL